MVQTYESGYISTLAAKLEPAATSLVVATAPTVTKGRLYLTNGSQEEWIEFNGKSGTTLQNLVRGLSQTADPATAGTGLTWLAGNKVILVAMHDQLPDKLEDTTYTGGTVQTDISFSGTTTAGLKVKSLTTVQRDLITPANGMIIYNTTAGEFQIYQGGAWATMASGSTQPDASTTVAGKVELATQAQFDAGTAIGETGASLVATPDFLRKQINTATAKATPVNADLVGIADSAASGVIKKTTLTELKAASDMQATTTTSGFVEQLIESELWALSDTARYGTAYQLGLLTDPTSFLSKRFLFWDDFLGVPDTAGTGIVQVLDGSGSVTMLDNPDNAHVGVLHLATGTATGEGAKVRTNNTVVMISGGVRSFETLIYIPDLVDGSDIYTIVAGFHDVSDTGVAITDGVYFLYSNASVNRQRVTENNNTATATASSTAVAADTRTRLKIVVNAAATSAEFFVNGTSIGSNTTNIPTARTLGFGVSLDKNGGTNSRSVYVDYVGASCLFTTAR